MACIAGSMMDIFMFIGAIIIVSVYYQFNYSHVKLFGYTIAFALLLTLISYMRTYDIYNSLGLIDAHYYGYLICKFVATIIMVYVFLLISKVYRKFS